MNSRFGSLIPFFFLIMSILACGGNEGAIGAQTGQPVNFSIVGLPQFVAPTSTPLPTHTQPPTVIQPTVYLPPSGYVTETPFPNSSCVWIGSTYICNTYTPFPSTTASYTPFPGGFYSTPAQYFPGSTSTHRPTYTPWPTPTPCLSTMNYYFGDEVFTDPSPEHLTLGIRISDIQTYPSSRSGFQIASYRIEIRNLGPIFYVLLAPFQIYVSEVGTQVGRWSSSEEAARELAVTLSEPALDGVTIEEGESVDFKLYAYVPTGQVKAIAYILDPYGNGFDGAIAGGNVAFWREGSRTECGGRISGPYTPQPNLTPNPTRTITPTIASCGSNPTACITIIP